MSFARRSELLEHRSAAARAGRPQSGPAQAVHPAFTFNQTVQEAGAFTESTGESNFYRMQLTVRYSF
ncbi:MAG: hypothetical protein HY704_01145 [Gemmatimonadetes bacterium]|nr:hypothetical protein [Gemmatimonadota bacterium]